jgi:acetyl-CoA carboxylase biotin carboxyl carrier protein
MTTHDNGRRFERELEALVKEVDGLLVLRAPRPGFLRDAPSKGRALREGERCGELEVLGTLAKLIVPADVAGLVVEENEHKKLARKPVGYADVIAVIDPKAVGDGVPASAGASAAAASGGLVWKTPLGGRYYGRPSPSAEPFVKVGDVIKAGHTVALIEVMKTFNRASYGGTGLPAEARVVRLLVKEGDDVNAGDALLAVEAT